MQKQLLLTLAACSLSWGATLTSTNGLYSATVDNTGNPGALTVTFNGPSGAKVWTYSGTDLLYGLVLGNKGILAFVGELTADPILQAIDYSGTPCNPCIYGGPLFTDPSNTSGVGRLPVHPSDFTGPSPYPGATTGPYSAFLTGYDANGMLTGRLSAFGAGGPISFAYTWDVMVNTAVPEPATFAMVFPVLAGLALYKRRGRARARTHSA